METISGLIILTILGYTDRKPYKSEGELQLPPEPSFDNEPPPKDSLVDIIGMCLTGGLYAFLPLLGGDERKSEQMLNRVQYPDYKHPEPPDDPTSTIGLGSPSQLPASSPFSLPSQDIEYIGRRLYGDKWEEKVGKLKRYYEKMERGTAEKEQEEEESEPDKPKILIARR